MAYEEIISFIRSNLNKDFEHDFNYLLKELVHYQSLPNGEQIVKNIVELIKSELGEEGIKKLKEIEIKGLKDRIDKYNTGIKLLQERKITEAQEIFVNLIDTFGIKFNDDVPTYNFQNIIESIIYTKVVNKEIQKIRQISEPIAGYYFHSALIFFQEKDFEESSKLLDTVLKYNPVYVEGMLLKAECYLKEGYSNLFLELVTDALKVSYTRTHLAKCYFLLGKYYLDLGFKELSMALLIVSKGNEQTPFIDQVIKQAANLPGGFIKFDNPDQIKEQLINNKIQFGPNPQVMIILAKITEEARNKKDIKLLKLALKIQYDLTRNESIKKELDELK